MLAWPLRTPASRLFENSNNRGAGRVLRLVEPRAVGRRVVDVEVRMGGEPAPDLRVLMGGIVVDDEMDVEARRDGGVDVAQEL